jgi:O-antigen ligase
MLISIAILLFGLGFLVFALNVRKPEHAVYGYLLVWMLCPKWAHLSHLGIDLPEQLTDSLFLSDFVNAIIAFGLLLVCLLRRPKSTPRYARSINFILCGFLLMAAVSLTSGLFCTFSLRSDLSIMDYYVRPTLSMVYDIIFGWAFLRYIDTQKKIERFLACFVVSGIELVCEVFLFYYFHLFPALGHHAINPDGRFLSLTYLSFDTVGLVAIIAICSTFYFAITRKSMLMVALMFLMFLPIVATLERGPLSAAVLSLCAVGLFCLRLPKRYLKIVLPIGLAGLLVSSVAILHVGSNLSDLPSRINRALGVTTGPTSTLQDTFFARVGLWFRGIDIYVDNFPFGAGNHLVDYYMGQPVPAHFYGVLDGRAYSNYRAVVINGRLTNTHNAFLEFIIENGIGGLVMLGVCILIILRQFHCFILGNRLDHRPNDRSYVAQACIYACMIGLAWRYFFEASDRMYFFLFSVLTMISILSNLDSDGALRRSKALVVVARPTADDQKTNGAVSLAPNSGSAAT